MVREHGADIGIALDGDADRVVMCDEKGQIIDGDQVLEYIDLPLADQEDLAGAIGSTVDMIVDNLLELQCGSIIL